MTRPVNMGHVNLFPRLSWVHYTSILMWVESQPPWEGVHCSTRQFEMTVFSAMSRDQSTWTVYNSVFLDRVDAGIIEHGGVLLMDWRCLLALTSLCWAENKTAMNKYNSV